jgi:HTH-type transcriptional regulator / antitoxin MqsA
MSTNQVICRICGEGHLQPQFRKNCVEYKGTQTELDLAYSVCDACGSEQAASDQLRANKRAMMRFKKTVDGLLIGAEVRAIREVLRLSQAEAAQVFGGGPVAFSKYENDDVAQSEAMDKMIRLAAELPAAFAYLARDAGLVRAIYESQWAEMAAQPVGAISHGSRPKVVTSHVNHDKPIWASAA